MEFPAPPHVRGNEEKWEKEGKGLKKKKKKEILGKRTEKGENKVKTEKEKFTEKKIAKKFKTTRKFHKISAFFIDIFTKISKQEI